MRATRPTGLRNAGRCASSTSAIATATTCASPPRFCRVRLAGAEHVLHPRSVGAAFGRDARGVLPDAGDVGPGLDQHDLDAEGTELVADRLGPALDRPLRGAIDRVGRLAHERRLARHDEDAAAPLRAEGRQQRARQLEHAEEVRLQDAAHVVVGQILEGAARRDAGIVHDRVEPAAGRKQHRARRLRARRLRSVTSSRADRRRARARRPRRAPPSSGPLRSRSRMVANTRQPRRASSTVASSPKPDEVPVIRTVRMWLPRCTPISTRAPSARCT